MGSFREFFGLILVLIFMGIVIVVAVVVVILDGFLKVGVGMVSNTFRVGFGVDVFEQLYARKLKVARFT